MQRRRQAVADHLLRIQRREGRVQAAEVVQMAMDLDPSLPEAHNTMAVIVLGGLDDAVDMTEMRTIAGRALPLLTQAIELRPTYIDALANRAYVRALLGDIEGAVQDTLARERAIYGIE